MATHTQPVAYTTTTTTSSTVFVAPRFDPSYIKTVPGILKIVRMVLDLAGFISVMVSDIYSSRTSFFSFVSMTGFWVTLSLLFMYLFHLIERASFLPWMLMEFIFTALWSFFYLAAAACVADWAGKYYGLEAYAAAAFFGFAAMIVYGIDAFLKFRGWRNNELAQGERSTSSTVTSPTAY